MLTLRPVARLAPPDRLALWNAAYSGYIAPLTFDQALLDRHVRRGGLDLERSVVGSVDGEDFGLSMAAFRDRRVWIGGFGVAPDFRRRGLATRLLAAHLERLDAGGGSEVWLEVIEANPAREVYRRCGFEEMRELQVLDGTPVPGSSEGETLAPDGLAALHDRLNRARPTWRRDLPTLLDILAHESAVPVGVDGGYALAQSQGERIALLDAAAGDRAAGERLLGAIAARWPGQPLRLVDEPTGTPLAMACQAAGFSVPVRQIEMVRRR